MDISLIYVTCPNEESAVQIAESLLKDRLVACGNLVPAMKSIYHWEGELKHETETLLILKTIAPLISRIQRKIAEIHPYEVPCIIEWQSSSINSEYRDWILDQLKDSTL